MPFTPSSVHKIILTAIGLFVLIMGVLLFFAPPAIFPDPSWGLQVMRSMEMGGSFNYFTTPDQGDIAQNYSEYLTWWSPGQYLAPYFFKLICSVNTGQALAITVTVCEMAGLAGLYACFKKFGFPPLVSAVSLLFIICQQAFVVPYVFYNGGELLIFGFAGWFLYGCLYFVKPDWKLLLFVLLSGWIGFFCKSSFVWVYVAGLFCLWIRLCGHTTGLLTWVKKGLWIGIPAMVSIAWIYVFFLSKGQNPASQSTGFKLSLQAFSFPLASPLLSGFSLDDMLHGLILHTDKVILVPPANTIVLIVLAILSLLIVIAVVKYVPNKNYKLFVVGFYSISVLFFCFAYLRELAISYEARHFRLIGLLIVPGIVYWLSYSKMAYKVSFMLLAAGIAFTSFHYLGKGYNINKNLSAKGVTGISQPYIDQASLNTIMKLDRENRNATFVFIGADIGLEVIHNRTIVLQPIGDDLRINTDDYTYKGHAGPLYMVLPESYNGPKEKMIMKSFPGYKGFDLVMLSDKYVLYSAK